MSATNINSECIPLDQGELRNAAELNGTQQVTPSTELDKSPPPPPARLSLFTSSLKRIFIVAVNHLCRIRERRTCSAKVYFDF